MKFLKSQDGYFNPMQVEAVVYDSQAWTMHYYDDRIEHYTCYTVHAVMTSGAKILLTSVDTKEYPEIDIHAVVDGCLVTIEEALSA